MKTKLFTTIALSALLLFGGANSAEAGQTVQVTLPSFDVTLNGQKIDNDSRQYPLILYKNITYFPMTYYDSRFLGLFTSWDAETGLGVNTYDGVCAYHIDTTGTKNKKNHTAQIAQGQITVNSCWVDNSKEEYPLLLFRDVTYFPLTWRFAVDEFGWEYQFDNANGLIINRANVATESVLLADGRNDEEYIFDFAIDENNLYYQGQQGEIYRRPLSDWGNDEFRETIAQVPYENDYYTGYPFVAIYEQNGGVYYQYHSGGASMGGNYLYRIDEEKPKMLLNRNYDAYTAFDNFGVRTFGPAVGSAGLGMMYVYEDGTMESIGPEWYKYYVQEDSYDAERNVLYMTTRQYSNDTNRMTVGALHEFDLATKELNKLSDSAYENYDVTEDAIYYQALQKLFMFDLESREENIIATSADAICNYAAIDKGVFYVCTETKNALSYWNKEDGVTVTINPEYAVTKLYSQNGYVVVHFEETPDNQHRLTVFDGNGNQVYSTMDVSDKAVINKDGVMVYRLNGTSQLVKVIL